MSERETPAPPPQLLAALRAERGECPDLNVLLEPSLLDEEERERLAGHLELCPTCSGIVRPEEAPTDDVTWRRIERELDRRERPWEGSVVGTGEKERGRVQGPFWVAAAALLALVLGVAGWQLRRVSQPPSASGVVRGSSIQGLEPVGTVPLEALRFRWRRVSPLDLSFRVEVRAGNGEGEVVWQGDATGESLPASEELGGALETGVAYRWRVIGVEEGADEVVAESSWIEFRLAEGEAPDR